MPRRKKTHWIVVTGGVISTLGKGIVTGSLGALLKDRGYKVTSVKIDPYINIDAGTMRPTEHGEVFVTFDGGETDQDLGNYERFLDEKIPKNQNITTGQVYKKVIEDERNLKFKGKCVEVIPHIPQEIIRRMKKAANDTNADIVTIEIGGTVGDYQNVLFLDAVRTMKLKGESVVFVHVSYLPVPSTAGEMKSKPTQHSVRALNNNGIQADFIVGRSRIPIDDVRREKISVFCNVKKDEVIACPDASSIYEVPVMFDKQKFDERVLKKLGLKIKKNKSGVKKWKSLVNTIKNPKRKIKIGIVGKYFNTGNFTLEDSYISVIEAIKHASYKHKVKAEIQWINSNDIEKDKKNLKKLSEYDAIIVPGGFGSTGVEGKIDAIKYVREQKIPFLGLCYGLQMAVVEHARHVIGLKKANSTEINENAKHPVVDILPEQKEKIANEDYGATMRLGEYPAFLKKKSQISGLYGDKTKVFERHRHRYEVNPEYLERLEKDGLVFSGMSPDRRLVEFLERDDHPYFIATQAHPEFTSRPLRPNPLFDGLIKAALKRQN